MCLLAICMSIQYFASPLILFFETIQLFDEFFKTLLPGLAPFLSPSFFLLTL